MLRNRMGAKGFLGGVLALAVVLVVGVIAAGGGSLGDTALAAGDEPGDGTGSISVTGEATIKARPDTVTITLGVQEDAVTAGEAMDRCSAALNRVVAAILDAGVPRADVQTSNLNLWPRYDYGEKGRGEIIGYRASNQVTLTWDRLDKIGDLIDAAVRAGANTVSGLSFSLADSEALYLEAVAEAVRDARQKAEVMAAAAGVDVGRVKNMSLDSHYSGPIVMREGLGGDMAASVPVEPGQVEMRVTVRVEYGIQ